MLWNLAGIWLVMAVTTVLVFSFFLGAAIDTLVREDAFGMIGNGLIIASGFFLAIFAANSRGYDLHELHAAVMVGLAGAFLCLALFTVGKAMAARF